MPILYRPLRQLMTPQNITIAPATNNFSLFISGTQCIAYRFSVYDMLNVKNTTISDTNKVPLTTPLTTLYDGEELVISKNVGITDGLVAGNQYKWQVALYGTDLTVSSINTTTDVFSITNHNLSNGDMVYVSATTLPEPLVAYTQYYIRKLTSDTLTLHSTYESARNGGTPINVTSTGTTVVISPIAITEQIPFSVYASPTLSLTSTTITKYFKEFTPIYTQSQGLSPIKFIAYLYDSVGVLLEEIDEIYSANLKYTLEGFLPDRTYGVRFRAWNKLNQEADTGIIYFPVSYSTAILKTKPLTTNNSENSSVTLGLDKLYQVTGVVDPVDGYDYIPNFNLFNDDIGLSLDIDASISFSGLDILPENTFIMEWIPDDYSTFDGDIVKLENPYDASEYTTIGYDTSLSKFYRETNGVTFYNAEKVLVDKQIYLITLTQDTLYTLDFYNKDYGYLEDYPRFRTLIYDSGINYAD